MMEFLKTNNKTIYSGILVVLVACLLLGYVPGMSAFSSWVTPPVALFFGLAFALLCGQAYPKFNKKVSKKLLQYSVVGLGFGMNLHASLASGKEGMLFTVISVIGTMFIGMFIGRKLLKVNRDTSYLISSGTAICGGSAIAAVGPVIKAKDSDMSVALATIFVLNAIALFVFPVLGGWLGLTQQEFGTWAAIAIHDTSSVVGAGAAYGEEALQVATTIKLSRALWIIPLALVTSFIFKSEGKKVLLAAGDTFRAGAIEQLEVWGERVGVDVVTSDAKSDPASVVFDALKKGSTEHYDYLLVDTAGRLQNKVNLMKELEKINRIIHREIPGGAAETLLVLDATTGQNALIQAKQFKETTDVTGLILTKLDGTAKGGVILAIRQEMEIPVKFVGLGEGMNDLQVFDPEQYIYGLVKDLVEKKA